VDHDGVLIIRRAARRVATVAHPAAATPTRTSDLDLRAGTPTASESPPNRTDPNRSEPNRSEPIRTELPEFIVSNVYKKIELVGSSRDGVDDAIRRAIRKAGESVRNLDWFEVTEIRGWIQDGEPQHTQVTVRVGFRLEDQPVD